MTFLSCLCVASLGGKPLKCLSLLLTRGSWMLYNIALHCYRNISVKLNKTITVEHYISILLCHPFWLGKRWMLYNITLQCYIFISLYHWFIIRGWAVPKGTWTNRSFPATHFFFKKMPSRQRGWLFSFYNQCICEGAEGVFAV